MAGPGHGPPVAASAAAAVAATAGPRPGGRVLKQALPVVRCASTMAESARILASSSSPAAALKPPAVRRVLNRRPRAATARQVASTASSHHDARIGRVESGLAHRLEPRLSQCRAPGHCHAPPPARPGHGSDVCAGSSGTRAGTAAALGTGPALVQPVYEPEMCRHARARVTGTVNRLSLRG
jgi:hypothetical protein